MDQKALRKSGTNFERIFHPKRLAIVGVSTEGGSSFGTGIFRSLQFIGYSGEIFLVNPKGGELLGNRIYKSVEDIPDGIDFAIIAVAARLVPDVLESCRLKGAEAVEILSAGFKELGTSEGIALEQQIKQIAARGIRVIGPNCFGIYCPKSGLALCRGPTSPGRAEPRPSFPRAAGCPLILQMRESRSGLNSARLLASATERISGMPSSCATLGMIRKRA